MCEAAFREAGQLWFISMENLEMSIFTSEEDYVAGLNAIAVNVARTGAKDFIDVIMSNHCHFIIGGDSRIRDGFMDGWRNQVSVYKRAKGLRTSLKNWPYKSILIQNLKAARNFAVYVARNGYRAMKDETPTGYPWGCGDLFFNGRRAFYPEGTPYNSLLKTEKRAICHSRDLTLPDTYKVHRGMITRESYICLPGIESFFNSGNQYFNMLARSSESDIAISGLTGDAMMIPDDEMFSNVLIWCRKDFNVARISELSPEQRYALAKRMRFEYHSNNRQIAQILRLTHDVVDQLFPTRR